jgi:hypothetical protein
MVASLNIGSCTFYSDLLLLHYVSPHMHGLSTPCIEIFRMKWWRSTTLMLPSRCLIRVGCSFSSFRFAPS